MRSILNISMSPAMKKEVSSLVKGYNYSSTSEFLRDAIRVWKERQLYNDVMESKRQFAQGKGKVLRSLRDLR